MKTKTYPVNPPGSDKNYRDFEVEIDGDSYDLVFRDGKFHALTINRNPPFVVPLEFLTARIGSLINKQLHAMGAGVMSGDTPQEWTLVSA